MQEPRGRACLPPDVELDRNGTLLNVSGAALLVLPYRAFGLNPARPADFRSRPHSLDE